MKRFAAGMALIMLIAGLAGCNKQPAPKEQAQGTETIDFAAIEQTLRQQQQAYADAWSRKDIEYMDTVWSHDKDVVLWGPAKRDRVMGWEGPGGIREWYLANMNAVRTIDFKFHDLAIKIGRDGRCAVITYYVENDVIDNDGNAVKMTPRVTVVKEIQDGQWKQILGAAHFSIEDVQAMQ